MVAAPWWGYTTVSPTSKSMGDESFRPATIVARGAFPGRGGLRGRRACSRLGSAEDARRLPGRGTGMPSRPREGKTVLKVRAAVSALLAATLAVTIAGCSFTNGNQTLPRKYDPSDGVGADVGELDIRNALIIDGEGDRGNLVVSVVNTTENTQPLSVQYESSATPGRSTVDLSVPAHSTVTYGYGKNEQLVLEGIDAEPGALFPLFFQSGSSEGTDLEVPVLDASVSPYETLTPSPSPTPTPTPRPAPTGAPTPSGSTIPAPTPTPSTAGK